jgi:hypothetical protein
MALSMNEIDTPFNWSRNHWHGQQTGVAGNATVGAAKIIIDQLLETGYLGLP